MEKNTKQRLVNKDNKLSIMKRKMYKNGADYLFLLDNSHPFIKELQRELVVSSARCHFGHSYSEA